MLKIVSAEPERTSSKHWRQCFLCKYPVDIGLGFIWRAIINNVLFPFYLFVSHKLKSVGRELWLSFLDKELPTTLFLAGIYNCYTNPN
jgi:hypothetical protein